MAPPSEPREPGESIPLKVLVVVSECAPFIKTGGLADVAGSLPKALRARGLDVRVVMPLYAGMPWRDFEVLDGALAVPLGGGVRRAAVRMARLPGSDVPVYFLDHRHYFDRPHVYGAPQRGYPDNIERFAFLSRGALELALALGFVPDVVHANDWQTALCPVYLNTVYWAQPLHGSASVFTIHNLNYQGVAGRDSLAVTGLGFEHYNPGEFEHFGTLNLMKAAVHHSTLLTTVSPTYAREIQTSAHGFGLDGVLRQRSKDLIGIVNGIDVHEWDPALDRHLPAHFSAERLEGKALCKAKLQEEAGLPVRPDVPLFGLIGRLVRQKGVDVLIEALDHIHELDLQIIVLGVGDHDLEQALRLKTERQPGRVRFWNRFDNALAHRIEAGCDLFLMPSRFEPCGLNQLFSLRYGTLPVVRRTGGLADTVVNYDERTAEGTGFVLEDLNALSLADTIGWAVATWFDRQGHFQVMRRRAMGLDFSWEREAERYVGVYLEAYARRRGHPFSP